MENDFVPHVACLSVDPMFRSCSLIASLILVTASAVVLTDPVAAHTCYSQNPDQSPEAGGCGPCTGSLPHYHYNLSADEVYCESGPLPPTVGCETPSDWSIHTYSGGTIVNDKLLGTGDHGLIIVYDECFDTDGHFDGGIGGAILTMDFETVAGCGLEYPHHGLTPIVVQDHALGSGATFMVGVDAVDVFGSPGCDSVTDDSVKCTGSCTPLFPPGADGAYWVFIHAPATAGSVYTT